MLKTITPQEMRRVETRAMDAGAASGEALMQRAAEHVALAAAQALSRRDGLVLCLCGTGNNGGDGLAAMRILSESLADFAGECWLLPGALSPDAARELRRLESEQPRVQIARLSGDEPPALPSPALIIDAMYGTGLSRPLTGMAAKLCEAANRSGARVIAVDIPSGLNGETGRVEKADGEAPACVRADETVTFHRPKAGLYLGLGPNYAGKITVADIGLPRDSDDADGLLLLEKQDLAALLPPRPRVSHKGCYGRAVLWVGSYGMAGAAAVAALAALRAGAGLVTVACPREIVAVVQTLCPCATCAPLDMADPGAAWAALDATLQGASAVGAGCGLGQSDGVATLLALLCHAARERALPCVLDADALNLLARGALPPDSLPRALCLTPHPAEAARLLGLTTDAVTREPLAAAAALREKYRANVILKGAASVLAAREGMALNPFGTPAMAKGGSGDALTGVLTALLAGRAAGAYRMGNLATMQAACALHGLAGELAARRYGERGALATDLCALLGVADA